MTRARSVRVRTFALFAAVPLAAIGFAVITRDATATLVGPGHPTLVSTVPNLRTPHVRESDPNVRERVTTIYDAGTKIIAGGPFNRVRNEGGTADIVRPFLFSFDEATGAVDTAFAPTVDGEVTAIIGGPTAGTIFIAGRFTNVNGQNRPKLALLNVADGSLVTTFKGPPINGAVMDIALAGDKLLVGGSFTKISSSIDRLGLASFDAATGALNDYLTTSLTVNHNWTPDKPPGTPKAPVGADKMALAPDGRTLVVIGNFKLAGGTSHDQVVKFDLGSAAATIADWNTSGYVHPCHSAQWDSYVSDVAFAPDSSYFVIVTTGGPVPGALCDSTARWEAGATGSAVQPTWVSYTGGDTLLSAAVSEKAVYVGGHQRWFNNDNASDTAFPGAIARPSIAALDPISGLPLSWNPGVHPRGFGTTEMYVTPQGLWIGYDQEWIGNQTYKRERIAFFPLAGGVAPHATNTLGLPGKVYTMGRNLPNSVLYRVNAGGETIGAADGGLPWAGDTAAAPSPRHNTGLGAITGRPIIANMQIPPLTSATPRELFSSERHATAASPNQFWDFPVARGTTVQVRLYFSNRCQCAAGTRRFHINIDGVRRITNFDITTMVGNELGSMRAWNLTSDGNFDIDLIRVSGTVTINAVEIVRQPPLAPTGNENKIYVRQYDGEITSSVPAERAQPAGTWSAARGGFWVGGTLFYAAAGGFYRMPFSATSNGPGALANPYNDPKWDTVLTQSGPTGQTYRGSKTSFFLEVPNVTGMLYSKGRMYYTIAGHSSLYWRWFSPDTGAVGAQRFSVTSPINFASAGGMFTNGSDDLYVVIAASGTLSRVDFVNEIPGGTPVTLSGPTIDGKDWRGKVVFVGP
ncbi:MAG TPA: malectin domain-containing carbohydrate-binding protein [Pilimelia sp.]|nr:malectin domain-containing carbohydrate-binding protein [Pilimelia sp.]